MDYVAANLGRRRVSGFLSVKADNQVVIAVTAMSKTYCSRTQLLQGSTIRQQAPYDSYFCYYTWPSMSK